MDLANVLHTNRLAQVFFGNDDINMVVKEITTMAKEMAKEFDGTTAEGRKGLAKVATLVNKSSGVIDTYGKDLVADQKKALKKIDDIRKIARDSLNELRAEIRIPITQFEEENKRLQEAALAKEQYLKDWTEALTMNELFDLRKKAAIAEAVNEQLVRAIKTDVKPAEKPVEKSIEKPVEKPVDRRKEVNRALLAFLKECGATEELATKIIINIATGKTKLLTINY